MLRVSAFEVSDPVEFLILVKSDDLSQLTLGLTFRLHGPSVTAAGFKRH